jgi:hypothetical protein
MEGLSESIGLPIGLLFIHVPLWATRRGVPRRFIVWLRFLVTVLFTRRRRALVKPERRVAAGECSG